MSWTYLKYLDEGEIINDLDLPPVNSVVLAFEALRWKVMIGHMEPIGEGDRAVEVVLDFGLNDDCTWCAWAPLGEQSDPDEALCEANLWFDRKDVASGYKDQDLPDLVRFSTCGICKKPISTVSIEYSSGQIVHYDCFWNSQ